jgi:hypothetical protein
VSARQITLLQENNKPTGAASKSSTAKPTYMGTLYFHAPSSSGIKRTIEPS